MTPSPSPIQPPRAFARSRVIQGFFPGGRPRIVQPSPAPAAPVRPQVPAPVQARPASPSASLVPGRPATGALQPLLRPGQPPRLILPTKLQPATPLRPPAPQPILPLRATPAAVQPHAGDAFPLPANFTLKPHGSGQSLPEPIQKKMEAFFNTSFADVRVHVGPEAPSIGALAFTHGTELYFAPGQYSPLSTQGQQLLGHELTHVVQQRAGRVRNPLASGIAVVQDPALEAEAERMGLRAATIPMPVQKAPACPSSITPPQLGTWPSGPSNAPQPFTVATTRLADALALGAILRAGRPGLLDLPGRVTRGGVADAAQCMKRKNPFAIMPPKKRRGTGRLIAGPAPKGTMADPIPIDWYKVDAIYQAINLVRPSDGQALNCTPNVAEWVDVPNGIPLANLGTAVTRVTGGGTLQVRIGGVALPSAYLGSTRQRTKQKRVREYTFKLVLAHNGFLWAGFAPDHILDLQLSGADEFNNLWPLDSLTNTRANATWNQMVDMGYGGATPTTHHKTIKLSSLPDSKWVRIASLQVP